MGKGKGRTTTGRRSEPTAPTAAEASTPEQARSERSRCRPSTLRPAGRTEAVTHHRRQALMMMTMLMIPPTRTQPRRMSRRPCARKPIVSRAPLIGSFDADRYTTLGGSAAHCVARAALVHWQHAVGHRRVAAEMLVKEAKRSKVAVLQQQHGIDERRARSGTRRGGDSTAEGTLCRKSLKYTGGRTGESQPQSGGGSVGVRTVHGGGRSRRGETAAAAAATVVVVAAAAAAAREVRTRGRSTCPPRS